LLGYPQFVAPFLDKFGNFTVRLQIPLPGLGITLDPSKLKQLGRHMSASQALIPTTFIRVRDTGINAKDPVDLEVEGPVHPDPPNYVNEEDKNYLKKMMLEKKNPFWLTAGGIMDWYSGGLIGAWTEHRVDIYCDVIFRFFNAKDHIHGHDVYLKCAAATVDSGCGRQGCMYEGYWAHGKRHGKGRQTWPNDGGLYEGDWVDGKMHGRGFRTWRLGETHRRYKGKFVEGKMHEGIETFIGTDGEEYHEVEIAEGERAKRRRVDMGE
jgi:hypothetical protein